MKTFIGGVIATVLGLIGLSVWFNEFLQFLAGASPIILLIGGGLAIYLGFDEIKDTLKKDDSSFEVSASSESPERYKQEISDLKAEIESLKVDKSSVDYSPIDECLATHGSGDDEDD